jgi:hypothetical protein
MRLLCERLRIRDLMVIIAALASGLATLVPKLGPLFAPRLRLAVANPAVSVGNIPQWTKGRQTWIVRNTGHATLCMWLHDQADCSLAACVFESASVVQADGRRSSTRGGRGGEPIVIGPGGRATIVMYWGSGQRLGPVRNYLDFRTNDPKQPRLRLTMLGEVIPTRPSSDDGPAALTANRR